MREHYYKVKQEVELAKFKENTKDVSITDIKPIPTDVIKDKNANTMTTTYSANLPANTYYPIHNFVQVSPDVYGGIGRDINSNPYKVNGNNNLYVWKTVRIVFSLGAMHNIQNTHCISMMKTIQTQQ